MKKALYSVVIPVYNEQGNLLELYRRLIPVMEKTDSFEIIFVNDGSSDKSLSILKGLQQKNKNIKIINLSRNFGQQAAITAGLENCSGGIITTIDADLQDPPELLPKFFAKLQSGFDVVYGVSKQRNDPPVRKFLIGLYYFIIEKFSMIHLPKNAGIFAVMNRPVVNALLEMSERNRFVPALRAWAGFTQTGIVYDKPARFSGKQSQSLGKLFKMGFDAVFSFSYVPLRLATYLGLFVSFVAFLMILNVLYQKLVSGTAILGWASPLISTLFIGGVELVILGIIGEYLGRIYDEVKKRPTYIVAEKIGF